MVCFPPKGITFVFYKYSFSLLYKKTHYVISSKNNFHPFKIVQKKISANDMLKKCKKI